MVRAAVRRWCGSIPVRAQNISEYRIDTYLHQIKIVKIPSYIIIRVEVFIQIYSLSRVLKRVGLEQSDQVSLQTLQAAKYVNFLSMILTEKKCWSISILMVLGWSCWKKLFKISAGYFALTFGTTSVFVSVSLRTGSLWTLFEIWIQRACSQATFQYVKPSLFLAAALK